MVNTNLSNYFIYEVINFLNIRVIFQININCNSKVFAGLRKNSHGDGTLALPGGKYGSHVIDYNTLFPRNGTCKKDFLSTVNSLIIYQKGHLEMYESWEDCAKREAFEETGLKIHHLKFGHVTNDIMLDQKKHYVTVFMMGECVMPEGVMEEELPQPKNLEPHKCEKRTIVFPF